MVCIPCIIAPFLLFIWYRFIQPIVLKFWNPWAPQKTVKSAEAKDGQKSCPFAKTAEAEVTLTNGVAVQDSEEKKSQ